MVGTVRALMAEEASAQAGRRPQLTGRSPCGPDHGQELLSDLGGHSTPGYPLIGRMRGLGGAARNHGRNALNPGIYGRDWNGVAKPPNAALVRRVSVSIPT